ncbi:MAG: amidohydrolase family protein [Nitrospinota bacterium]
MGKILIKNGFIVTLDSERRVFDSGFVAVEGSAITAVGGHAELESQGPFDEVFDVRGMIVLPGLINAHTHHLGNLFKGVRDGFAQAESHLKTLYPLLSNITDEDMRVSSYLACIEMLKTGTTCCLNHLIGYVTEETIQAVAEPVIELGMRQTIGTAMANNPERPFSKEYPLRMRHPRTLDEELDLAESVISNWHGAAAGRVRIALAIETQDAAVLYGGTTEDLIIEGTALAEKYDLKITTHSAADPPSKVYRDYLRLTGRSDIEFLVNLGVLSPVYVLVHCVGAGERDIQSIGESGASVVTNPVANAFLCNGVAPVKRMMQNGINVALGNDTAMINHSVDMIEQMKFCSLLQNVFTLDPTAIPPEKALEFATINGAKALGIEGSVGSLEMGRRADVVIFDLRGANTSVVNRPVSNLVYGARGLDANLVMVDGKILVKEGKLVAFDREEEVIAEATERAQITLKKAGLTYLTHRPWPR